MQIEPDSIHYTCILYRKSKIAIEDDHANIITSAISDGSRPRAELLQRTKSYFRIDYDHDTTPSPHDEPRGIVMAKLK